jgi:hypothetical protein
MKKTLTFMVLIISIFLVGGQAGNALAHPIEKLVGEKLSYDVSFLWFDRLAVGSISLERGEQPDTYVATLEARTCGFAAFVTKHRVERYQSVMEIDADGMLRPLVYSTRTLRGEGKNQRENLTSYSFDYANHQVEFQKTKRNRPRPTEILPLNSDQPVYDILSAFYNLRIGTFGPLEDQQIHMPTYDHNGVEEIIVAPLENVGKDKHFFAKDNHVYQVLLDPEVFHTDGNDLLISFDENNRPQKAVVKNVIGLGDVRGVLRKADHTVAMAD